MVDKNWDGELNFEEPLGVKRHDFGVQSIHLLAYSLPFEFLGLKLFGLGISQW